MSTFRDQIKWKECPDCEGGGIVAKLYPSGHTEATCERCDGLGQLDASEDDEP